jgi:uncharacterized protein
MENVRKQIPIGEGLFYIPSSPGEKPYLMGSKCKNCGNVTFPKRDVCPRCVKPGSMEEYHIYRGGKLSTFSIVNAALPGFKMPSIQAYIDLEEGPRIWSILTEIEPDEKAIKIGMELELAVVKTREDAQGNDVMTYQFRPANK